MTNTRAAGRSLGFWRCWSLVVGGTIGSAVFMMPAVMAPYGGVGLLSLVAATLGALAVALVLASLARRVTTTGGVYVYTRVGFGDFAGFLVAWGYWISLWVSSATIAVAFAAYLGALVPAVGASAALAALGGLALIWGSVAVNSTGVRESGIASLATTLLKIAPLLVVGCVGLWLADFRAALAPPSETGSPLGIFGSVFALTFWNFVGIESATVPAEDTIDPDRTIPRALLVGTLTVGAVYLLVAFAALTTSPGDALAHSPAPLTDVGTHLLGSAGGLLVTLGALVSTAGCLNTTVLAAGQAAMAAARDGLFPRLFSRLSGRQTPTISYALVGLLASVLLALNFSKGFVGAYTFLGLLATLTSVVPYAFAAAAGLILERRQPAATRSRRWREAGVAWVAFLVCMWVIAASGVETVYWGFLLLMAGVPVYTWQARGVAPGDAAPQP